MEVNTDKLDGHMYIALKNFFCLISIYLSFGLSAGIQT